MKRLLNWFLNIISRKVSEDYASGDNGWGKAIEKRRITEGAKRIKGI
jgi:hypothetical protein